MNGPVAWRIAFGVTLGLTLALLIIWVLASLPRRSSSRCPSAPTGVKAAGQIV